jgi:hypothetical protein
VAEQALQDDDVDAGFEHVGGVAVPKRLSTLLIHRRCESATGIIHFSTRKVTSCGDFAAKPKTATLLS